MDNIIWGNSMTSIIVYANILKELILWGLSIYTLILSIKALKIYIKKNS